VSSSSINSTSVPSGPATGQVYGAPTNSSSTPYPTASSTSYSSYTTTFTDGTATATTSVVTAVGSSSVLSPTSLGGALSGFGSALSPSATPQDQVDAAACAPDGWKTKAIAAMLIAGVEGVALLLAIAYTLYKRRLKSSRLNVKRSGGNSYAQLGTVHDDSRSSADAVPVVFQALREVSSNQSSDDSARTTTKEGAASGTATGSTAVMVQKSSPAQSPIVAATLTNPFSDGGSQWSQRSRQGSQNGGGSQMTSSSRLTPGIAGIGHGIAAMDATPYDHPGVYIPHHHTGYRPPSVTETLPSRSSLSTYVSTDRYNPDPFGDDYNPMAADQPFGYNNRISASVDEHLYPSGPESEYTESLRTSNLGRSASGSTTRTDDSHATTTMGFRGSKTRHSTINEVDEDPGPGEQKS
jgi:hypothetical protein